MLRFALGYAIVNIQRESHRSGSTHIMTNYYLVRGKPSLLRIVAAISFSLVNLINQIGKGNNDLNFPIFRIKVCKIPFNFMTQSVIINQAKTRLCLVILWWFNITPMVKYQRFYLSEFPFAALCPIKRGRPSSISKLLPSWFG